MQKNVIMSVDHLSKDFVIRGKKLGEKNKLLHALSDVSFDIYEGEHVASGQKSVAIALTFQDATKTLDDTTINTMIEQILKVVEKDYGAHLRV